MSKNALRVAVTLMLSVLAAFSAPTVANAAPEKNIAASSAVTAVPSDAVPLAWQAYGYYFGLDTCQEAGRMLVSMGLARAYRCLRVAVVVWKLEIDVEFAPAPAGSTPLT